MLVFLSSQCFLIEVQETTNKYIMRVWQYSNNILPSVIARVTLGRYIVLKLPLKGYYKHYQGKKNSLILAYEEKLEVVLKFCLKRMFIVKVHAVGGDSKLIFLLTLF